MPLRPLLLAALLAAPLPAAAQLTAQSGPAAGPGLNYVAPLGPAALAQIQERLRAAGDYAGRTDGVWGADSQAALERFQNRNGLQASGTMNPGTAATLRLTPPEIFPGGPGAAPATPAPDTGAGTPPPTPLGTITFTPALIRAVQTNLRALGLYAGYVDGTWGPYTQAALVRFQTGRGLPADGQVTPATLGALGVDPANPAFPGR